MMKKNMKTLFFLFDQRKTYFDFKIDDYYHQFFWIKQTNIKKWSIQIDCWIDCRMKTKVEISWKKKFFPFFFYLKGPRINKCPIFPHTHTHTCEPWKVNMDDRKKKISLPFFLSLSGKRKKKMLKAGRFVLGRWREEGYVWMVHSIIIERKNHSNITLARLLSLSKRKNEKIHQY